MRNKFSAIALTVVMLSLLVAVTGANAQGTPVNALQIDNVPIFDYHDGKELKHVMVPVALATRGLWGPLPETNPMAAHFWQKYGEAGYKKEAEHYGDNTMQMRQFTTPFMRLTALQVAGTPVEVKVLAPQGEEIKMPLVGSGGQAGQRYYRFWNRRLELRALSGYGDSFILCDGKNKADCMLDRSGMTMTWNPSQTKDRFYAPKVLELVLAYNVASGVIVDGKKRGTEQKGVTKARIAWLALPACGQEWDDGQLVNCPTPPAPQVVWQVQTSGPVSVAIPSNWTAEPGPDGISRKFQLGDGRPPLAGVVVMRMPGVEDMLKGMSDVQISDITVNGQTAKVHTGKVKGTSWGKILVFNQPLGDGKPLALIGASSQPDKYQALVDAALASLVIGQGDAALPSIPAAEQAAPVPKLGNGSFSYTPAGGPLPEDATVSTPAPAPTQPSVTTSAPTLAPPTQTPMAVTAGGQSSARLVRLQGFGDYAGRSEEPKGDGSADAYIKLRLDAPGQTVTGFNLREAGGGKVIWDTSAGNGTWLIVATKGGKVLNAADGSLDVQLGQGAQSLDLWVQDDHTLAHGRQKLELVVELRGGAPLVLPLADTAKR